MLREKGGKVDIEFTLSTLTIDISILFDLPNEALGVIISYLMEASMRIFR